MKKKLKLEIDALVVESFEAAGIAPDSGTVRGLANTPGCDSIQICLPNDPSYDPCGQSADLGCTGSCQNSDCPIAQTCTCGC